MLVFCQNIDIYYAVPLNSVHVISFQFNSIQLNSTNFNSLFNPISYATLDMSSMIRETTLWPIIGSKVNTGDDICGKNLE